MIEVLILDNIRSVYNVGSLFRTADAFGVKEIALCGVTPSPVDRFKRKRSDLAKVALGAEDSVNWRVFSNTEKAINFYKTNGFEVYALEQASDSLSLTVKTSQELKGSKKALVLGEERYGITKDLLYLCDKTIEIPMQGEKESLNVSVAGAIALFAINT